MRREELLKVANVLYSQAKRSQTPTVKRALQKMGGEYEREAEMLRAQSSEGMRRRRPLKVWKAAA